MPTSSHYCNGKTIYKTARTLKKILQISEVLFIYCTAVNITPLSTGISLCSRDKIRPDLPDEEINVDMMVIARRRPMRWQRGKIVEIITKGEMQIKGLYLAENRKKSCLIL